MQHYLFYALIVVLCAVVCVLITGVTVFVKGGELNRRYGNRLMNLRVATQFVAVIILGILLLLHQYQHH